MDIIEELHVDEYDFWDQSGERPETTDWFEEYVHDTALRSSERYGLSENEIHGRAHAAMMAAPMVSPAYYIYRFIMEAFIDD